jgi:hypothetical protein
MLEYASSEIRQPVPVDLTDASLTFTAMADEIVLPIPNLELPQHFFTLSTPSLSEYHENAAKQLLAGIKTDRKLPDVGLGVRLGLFGPSF